jgi:hypothetical protein
MDDEWIGNDPGGREGFPHISNKEKYRSLANIIPPIIHIVVSYHLQRKGL